MFFASERVCKTPDIGFPKFEPSCTNSERLGSLTWSSSDPTIAQITNDSSNAGVVHGISQGNVTITASANGVVNTPVTLNIVP